MVIYSCSFCDYHTTIKTHLNRHNTTQKHLNLLSKVDDESKHLYKKVYPEKNPHQHQGNHKFLWNEKLVGNDGGISNTGNTKVTQSNTKIYCCEHCEKEFIHRNSYYRHIKHYCKNKKNEVSFSDYKEQQNLMIKILMDSKNELIESKNELIAEKEKNIKMVSSEKEKLLNLKYNKCYQYNDNKQINDSFNTMNNTNYVINYLNYSQADSMENIKEKFKLTKDEFIKASQTNGYRGALMEKAENIIIKPYLKAQEKRPIHTVDYSRKKALFKDDSNDKWTFNPKTTLEHCFITFHNSALDHQDRIIKDNEKIVILSNEDNLYKQTYFIPTDTKNKENIYRDVKNHIYKETQVNRNKLIESDNEIIKNIEGILLEN
jgi:hypothetical protein